MVSSNKTNRLSRTTAMIDTRTDGSLSSTAENGVVCTKKSTAGRDGDGPIGTGVVLERKVLPFASECLVDLVAEASRSVRLAVTCTSGLTVSCTSGLTVSCSGGLTVACTGGLAVTGTGGLAVASTSVLTVPLVVSSASSGADAGVGVTWVVVLGSSYAAGRSVVRSPGDLACLGKVACLPGGADAEDG